MTKLQKYRFSESKNIVYSENMYNRNIVYNVYSVNNFVVHVFIVYNVSVVHNMLFLIFLKFSQIFINLGGHSNRTLEHKM